MDKILTVKIDASFDNKTVKYVLQHHFGLSLSIVKALKRTENGIMLNGERVFVNRKVTKGDELVVTISDKSSANICASDIPLDVLYEDEDIIALNKPRMMPTHPSQKHFSDTLANGLAHYFANKPFTFRVITRLDRDTSGVVLVAKNQLSASVLSGNMKDGEINKEYIAVVNGVPNEKSGRIDAPIKRKEKSIILRCIHPDGKRAITEYETLAAENGLSLLRLYPLTGRTHQLRVHLSHIGTPIYGDDMYGAPQNDKHTLLHCEKISFSHPSTKKVLTITAPIPEDISNLFNL